MLTNCAEWNKRRSNFWCLHGLLPANHDKPDHPRTDDAYWRLCSPESHRAQFYNFTLNWVNLSDPHQWRVSRSHHGKHQPGTRKHAIPIICRKLDCPSCRSQLSTSIRPHHHSSHLRPFHQQFKRAWSHVSGQRHSCSPLMFASVLTRPSTTQHCQSPLRPHHRRCITAHHLRPLHDQLFDASRCRSRMDQARRSGHRGQRPLFILGKE